MSSGMLADLKLIQAVEKLVGTVKVRPAAASMTPTQPDAESSSTSSS